MRVPDTVTAARIRLPQLRVQSRAQHAHRGFLEPAGLVVRRDRDELGSGRFAQACGQGIADRFGGEVLGLGEDAGFRDADRVAEEVADFEDRRVALPRRRGARNADFEIGRVRAESVGPRVGIGNGRFHGRAARPRPALAEQLPEGARRSAVDDRVDVVEWCMAGAVRVPPARAIGGVGRRVPARTGQVEPADERECIVDHDQLLVV